MSKKYLTDLPCDRQYLRVTEDKKSLCDFNSECKYKNNKACDYYDDSLNDMLEEIKEENEYLPKQELSDRYVRVLRNQKGDRFKNLDPFQQLRKHWKEYTKSLVDKDKKNE